MKINTQKLCFNGTTDTDKLTKNELIRQQATNDCHSFLCHHTSYLITFLFLCFFPAHPNIKLFITQCGLQSFQEAVYHGVPILGVPFIGDQKYNAKKIVTEEIGLQLSFHEITKETLLTTIKEMLNNSK
jgi:UDP-N-acetylglucosamine:LPS N-acetylglucosamine transferase